MKIKYTSNIPKLMYEKRVSRMDLVRKAGLSYTTATKVEDESIDISLSTAINIAEALGLTLNDLFERQVEQ